MPLTEAEKAGLLADAASASLRADCRQLRALAEAQALTPAEFVVWASEMNRLFPQPAHPAPRRPIVEKQMLL